MSEISFSESAADATLTKEIAGRYHSEVRITKKQKKVLKKYSRNNAIDQVLKKVRNTFYKF